MKEYKCDFCGKTFNTVQSFGGHKSRCGDALIKYKESFYIKNKDLVIREHIAICKKCGAEYIVLVSERDFKKGNYKKFCSSQCSHSRIVSNETRMKTSHTLTKERKCIICGQLYTTKNGVGSYKYCSEKCVKIAQKHRNISVKSRLIFSECGKRLADSQKENKRSKNEKYFCLLCEKQFTNVEHNERIFFGWDSDIIIHDIKYAVMWNGIWHHKKVTKTHNLDNVKKLDDLKIDAINKFGYIPYVINDFGKYNERFVEEEFDKFINYINGISPCNSIGRVPF